MLLPKTSETHFLQDILRQPRELQRAVEVLSAGAGQAQLNAAVRTVRSAEHIYLTGIGSSWHAALNVGAIFSGRGRPVYLQDASELLQFATIAEDSVLIVISRSGRSIEIVQLLAKARESGAKVIGITNAPDGALAREAQFPVVVSIELDHAISVNTYTTLALAAGLLASQVIAEGETESPQGLKPKKEGVGMSDLRVRPARSESATEVRPPGSKSATDENAASSGDALAEALSKSLAEVERAIPRWQEQLEDSAWLRAGSTTYFLARGSSLGSAYEARLMWEEGVKTPATAMGAASFRHGPQEIVAIQGGGVAASASRRHAGAAGDRSQGTVDNGMRFGIWIDAARMRNEDLALARDLRQLGARVMLIGQNLPADAGDLVFSLPAIPAEWQFVIDIIPAQLTAERLARLSGVDPDTFRLCSFVVEADAGLLPSK
jgi:glutamine---fructose-6-phosphate transaminase (isomerizing)